MPRPATGSLRWDPTRGMWTVRVTLADGTRSRPIVFDKLARCEVTPDAPARGCECSACDRARQTARAASRRVRERGVVDAATRLTFNEYADRWLAERDRRGLASNVDTRARLAHHVRPALGVKALDAITRDDLKALVRSLDDRVRAASKGAKGPNGRALRFSWKTAVHVWGDVTKLFSDAVDSKDPDLCVLAKNPALGVRGPDKGKDRMKQYLWPSEALAFMSCADVPLVWRRFYAVSTYLYARPEEVEALEWVDVDLEHGLITIHRALERSRHRALAKGAMKDTKTDGSMRTIPIDPSLLPLLEAMHDECGGKGRVFPSPPSEIELARQLRRYLRIAGVEREALYINDATRQWVTWYHATRATGLTWEAVRGTDPLKIMQRAGHRHFSTTQGYVREAENLRARLGGAFPPLPPDIVTPPGVSVAFRLFRSKQGRNPVKTVGATGFEGAPESPAASTSEAREPEKTGADAVGESSAKSTVLDAESTRAAEPDPDAALRAAIKAAVDNGQWTRVRALTDVLEKSEAKSAPVVELVAHRRREGG